MTKSELISKSINSIGLLCDILGAWLVAWEVVRQYRGAKHRDAKTLDEGFEAPKETDEFKAWENNKYLKMKSGLFFLTLGFILQILSLWPFAVDFISSMLQPRNTN